MRRPLGTVAAATLTLFFAIAALLVFQLRTGRDPALGQQVAQTPVKVAPKPKRVLIRKVIVTRVIHDAPRAPASPAPVQRTSTTPAAPASAPAAPAPAPAPLTTQSS